MPKQLRVVISGRVQGVGYRGWAVAKASSLGIEGWVRNLSDGTVEAVFSGTEATLESMIEACKEGPPTARVMKIEMFTWDDPVEGGGFRVS